jgi:hypothetical protein
MVTIELFQQMSENERRKVLWEAAKVADRTDGIYRYELLQINDFYVEEKWSSDYSIRYELRIFKELDGLEPYFRKMDIVEIFKKGFRK